MPRNYDKEEVAMYNQESKQAFLRSNPSINSSAFKKTSLFERELNKDVLEFNEEELRSLFNGFSVHSLSTIKAYKSNINKYINWGVKRGFITRNHLAKISREFFNNLAQETAYITAEKLYDITGRILQNAQDAVILQLLFEGCLKEELYELKAKDVDFKNATLSLDGRKEKLSITPFAVKLIEKAMSETTYLKKNGEMLDDLGGQISDRVDIVNSDYVIKKSRTNATIEGVEHTINNRLSDLKKIPSLEDYSKVITVSNLRNNGILYLSKRYLDEHGSLEGEVLRDLEDEITERYQRSLQYEIYKYYINEDVIRKIYSIEDDVTEYIHNLKRALINAEGVELLSELIKKDEVLRKMDAHILERTLKNYSNLSGYKNPAFSCFENGKDVYCSLYYSNSTIEEQHQDHSLIATRELLDVYETDISDEEFQRKWLDNLDASGEVKEVFAKARKASRKTIDILKKRHNHTCQVCGEDFAGHGADIVEVHHIEEFSINQNHHWNNIMIVCPNDHRLIHAAGGDFIRERGIIRYSNGKEVKLKNMGHLTPSNQNQSRVIA